MAATAGNEAQCEQALVATLSTFTTKADVENKQREWVRNVVTYKYLNGDGTSGAYKLRTTVQNSANSRSSVA